MLMSSLVSSCSRLEIKQAAMKGNAYMRCWLLMNRIFKPGKKERICLIKMRKKEEKDKRWKRKGHVLNQWNCHTQTHIAKCWWSQERQSAQKKAELCLQQVTVLIEAQGWNCAFKGAQMPVVIIPEYSEMGRQVVPSIKRERRQLIGELYHQRCFKRLHQWTQRRSSVCSAVFWLC